MPTSYARASVVAAVVHSRPLYVGPTHAFAYARDPKLSTSIFVAVLSAAIMVVGFRLLIGNALVFREAWPLFTAGCLQLGWSLFLFARILIVRR